MGVKTWLQWSAWFLEYFTVIFITLAPTVFIICCPVKINSVTVDGVHTTTSHYRPILDNVDLSFLMFFLFICILPAIAANFLISAFCSKGMDVIYNALFNTIQYNTIQYNTIQYNTIQYNTIQYNTIQYNTIQYNTIQYNTIQYNLIHPVRAIALSLGRELCVIRYI